MAYLALSAADQSPALQRVQGAAGEGDLTQVHKISHPTTICKPMHTAQLSAVHASTINAHTRGKPNSSA